MAKKSPVAPVQAKSVAGKASLASSGFDSISLTPDYTPIRQPAGKVVGVWGNALIRRSSGEIQPVQVGDEVRKGDVLLTTQDGIVQLEGPGMRLARLPGLLETDRALAATDEEFEAPAAGLTGGADGGFSPGLRVDRIVEAVTPLDYNYDGAADRFTAQAADTNTETGLPGLVIDNVSLPESAGFAVFAVQLSSSVTTPTTINLALTSGTAAAAGAGAAGDFGSSGAGNLQVSLDNGATWVDATSVTLPAGQTSVLVRTPLVDDALNEAPETFTLTATPVDGAISLTPATGTATITDNDPQPTLVINDVTVNEGAGTATFTVSLSSASGQVVTVNWSTIDGVALGGTDFTTSSGSLSFQPGQTTQTLSIPVLNDSVFERSEAFTVQLANVVNAGIADGSGTATITDDGTGAGGTDDDTPIAALSGPVEVNEAAGTVTYTVTLSNLSTLPVTIPYSFRSTGDVGATLGTDVVANPGTLVIPAGALTGTFTVRIVEDSVFENAETYAVDLGTPTNAKLGNATVTTRVLDGGSGFTPDGSDPSDDRPVVSAISNPSVVEGGGLDFVVTLSGTSTTDTLVTIGTASGTGMLGTDTATPLQVSFDGGATWQDLGGTVVTVPAGGSGFTLRVPTTPDNLSEADETITLSAATAQNVAAVVGTGTIVDNDGPVVTISGPAVVNEAAGTLTYTIQLSNPSTLDVTVPFDFTAPASGGATLGTDFTTAPTRSVLIPAGQTTATVTVSITEDAPFEGPEVFNVVLGTPTNATLGAANSVATTINDDGTGDLPNGGVRTDDRPVTISSPSVFEGGALGFVVTLAGANGQATAYPFALTPQGSTTAADYNAAGLVFSDGVQLVDGRLVVPAGVASFTVTLPTVEDSTIEANETLALQVGNSSGGIGTILNEDATLTVDESALAEGNREAATQVTQAIAEMGFGVAGSSYQFAADAATALAGQYESGGTPIQWTLSNGNLTLTGSLPATGSAEGVTPILSVTLNAATGATTVALLGPIDHPGAGAADTLALLPLPVVATSAAGSDTRSLTVNITDDVPTAGAQAKSVAIQDTNLLIVLDTSGSMRDTDGRADGQTRLQLAVASVKRLIALYEDAGDVQVTLLTFSNASGAEQVVVKGATAAAALAAIDARTWVADGFTNYDAAISNAMAQYSTVTPLANALNVSYFLSDGKPEGATDALTTQYQLDAAEQGAWQSFLSASNLQSYAIGLGSQLINPATSAPFLAALNAVAYDGRNATDPTSAVLTVQDVATLDTALASTVPAPVTGVLLGGVVDTNADAGADGGYLSSVTVAGRTYSFDGSVVTVSDGSTAAYDASTDVLTIVTAPGEFKVNLVSGAYNYDATTTEPLSVAYTILDSDGDSSSATLALQAVETSAITGTLEDNTLAGGAGAEYIDGRAGNDTITAGAGNDVIHGGAGNDTLTGGEGSDVFAWRLADATSGGSTDTITDFDPRNAVSGGDILDLRDLLQGEHAGSNLTGFLHFTTEAGTTTLHVSSAGSFTPGNYSAENQAIVLNGVDLSGIGTDAQIIQNLLNQSKLVVDN